MSVLFFYVGGSLAEVSGNETTFLGFTFKASGALGGFILIFWLSLKGIERLKKDATALHIKLHAVGTPDAFTEQDLANYECEGWAFDEDTGDRRTFTIRPRWEAGFLTLDFRDVGQRDYIGISVKTGETKVWRSEDIQARTHVRDVKRVL